MVEVIEGVGQRLEEVLQDVEGTVSVYSERVAGGRYIDVDIDRQRASRFGLNIADVQEVVSTALGGNPHISFSKPKETHFFIPGFINSNLIKVINHFFSSC